MILESKYIPEPNSGCWLWLGAINKAGYGQIRYNKKIINAHRYYYQKYNNITLPYNVVVRHKCDNRLCVNPDHMEIGSHQDNMNDMVKRNRSAKGENHGNNILTENEVIHIYNSKLTNKELADCYSVNIETIRLIRVGKIWKWLTNP